MWNSSTEELTKLRNHMSEHGSTDTLLIAHDLLYSSSYNLDTGAPSINGNMRDGNMHCVGGLPPRGGLAVTYFLKGLKWRKGNI